jgi:hypothetical protein
MGGRARWDVAIRKLTARTRERQLGTSWRLKPQHQILITLVESAYLSLGCVDAPRFERVDTKAAAPGRIANVGRYLLHEDRR